MRHAPILLSALAGVAGCTDDGPTADPYACVAAGGGSCFELPTDVVGAADASGTPVLPALACGPYDVVTSAAPIALSGHIVDLDDPQLWLGEVRLEAFSDMEMRKLLFDVTSAGVDGAWSATAAIPGHVFARTTAAGQLPVHAMYRRMDVATPVQEMLDFRSATRAQVAAIFERVGDRFLPRKSQLTAYAYDCNGNKLVNVIANIAPASGKTGSRLFEPNVRTYYGVEGDTPALGRRTEIMQTSSSGFIGIANIPPGFHYVQLWGYPDAAAIAKGPLGLTLLDEKELFVGDDETYITLPLYGRL